MHWLRTATIVLTLFSFTACTTMRTIQDPSPTGIQQEVEPGDEVRIALMDGRKFNVEVEKVGSDSLTGVTPKGKRYKFDYASIRWLEVEETDTGGVVGSIVGGIGVAYLAALVFVAAIVASAD